MVKHPGRRKQRRVRKKLPCSVYYHTDARHFSEASGICTRYRTAHFILLEPQHSPPSWCLSFQAGNHWEETGDALQGIRDCLQERAPALYPGQPGAASGATVQPRAQPHKGSRVWNKRCWWWMGWAESIFFLQLYSLCRAHRSKQHCHVRERGSRTQLEKWICRIRQCCAHLNVQL